MHAEFHLSENKPLDEYKLPVPLFHVCITGSFNQSLEKLPSSVDTIKFCVNNLLPYNTIPFGITEIIIHTFPTCLQVLNVPASVKIIKINYLPISITDYMTRPTMFVDIRKKNLDTLIPILFQKIPFGCVVLDFFNEQILP